MYYPNAVQHPSSESAPLPLSPRVGAGCAQKSLCQVDVRNADAFDAADKQMIMKAVEQTVGFSEVNALVLEPLRKWVADCGLRALAKLSPQQRAGAGAQGLTNRVAKMLEIQGRLREAEALYGEALGAGEQSGLGSLAVQCNQAGVLVRARAQCGEPLRTSAKTSRCCSPVHCARTPAVPSLTWNTPAWPHPPAPSACVLCADVAREVRRG